MPIAFLLWQVFVGRLCIKLTIMKKSIVMTIALLCMIIQGAWAQGANQTKVTNLADLTTDNSEYVVQDGETLTGKLKNNVMISIADGATVTLSGVTINIDAEFGCFWAGLTCLGDATIFLADGTENIVKGFHNRPGILIPKDKTLTIDGNGKLNAICSDWDLEYSAGIGGRYSDDGCGNIVIKGGIIKAMGSDWGAGIGGGGYNSCGYIRIEGGVITAIGGKRCPGIGVGRLGQCGTITITKDAVVTAIAGEAQEGVSCPGPCSIGRSAESILGEKSTCGKVTIGCTLGSNGNPVGGHVGVVTATPFTYYWYNVDVFDANGNSTGVKEKERGYDSQKITYNSTREGYTFMGWVAENGGHKKFYPVDTKYSDLDVEPHTTINVYPQWIKGDGSETAPYEIASADNWLTMASYINNRTLELEYNGKHYKLMDNISVAEMVAEGETPATMLGINEFFAFGGTFDGNGKTITLDYTDNRDEHYCGPFRFINGATIKDLHVAGTIVKTKQKNAGGFIGKAYGTNTIINCRSSVDIQAGTDGDCSHGGFIGDLRNGETTLTGCTFDGKMSGPGGTYSRSKKWGGFIGWVADGTKAIFNNCLFAPTEIKLSSQSDSRTFARRDDGDDVTLTNCYYTETLGSAQGSQAYSIRGDEHVKMILPTEPENSYDVSGIASYEDQRPIIIFNGVIYAPKDTEVWFSLNQIGDTPEGCAEGSFIATPGSLKKKYVLGRLAYFLTMPNANVTISLAPSDLTGTGSYANPYLIYNDEQWKLLVERVNSGNFNGYENKVFRLMADITLSETHNDSGSSDVMIGVSSNDNTKFRGIFDGNGHTITLDISDTTDDDFCAPFRYIKGATIENLHVDGTIVKTSAKNAGGLVGKAEGTNTLKACWSSVGIKYNKNGDVSSGGLIGELRGGGTTTLTDCLFDGKLQGGNAYNWGGFVGWVASDNTVSLNNCLFNPSLIEFDINDGSDGSKTFARKDGTANIWNCYYKTLIKDAQGATDASSYSSERLLEGLGDGWHIINGEVVPIIGLYYFDGEGTQVSPYVIASTGDWDGLASNVAQGETYSGKFFQLAANISVSRMVGSTEDNAFKAFQGSFDGAGNKLTFNYTATRPFTAPFRCVDGATIENLHVGGTISTSASYAAGLLAYVKGYATIRNCRSSVNISITSSDSKYNGGFIARNDIDDDDDEATTTITGCLFDGSLQFSAGITPYYCGGFVGENYAKMQLNDCLFNPADEITNSNCKTFVYVAGTCQMNNSYYTLTLGEAQGKQAHSITGGEGVTIENVGLSAVTEYDVSGITGYFPGIVYNDVIYAGNGDDVRLNLNYDDDDLDNTVTCYTASAGTLSGTDNPYKLTMPDADVTITATIAKNTLELANDADNSTVISEAVESGKVYDVTLADRTLFHDNHWNTLCLPFNVNAFEDTPLEDATVMELDIYGCYAGSTRYTRDGEALRDTNGNAYEGETSDLKLTGFDSNTGTLYLYFKSVTSIEAGKPYIVKWSTADANAGVNPTFSDVTITSTAPETYIESEDAAIRFIGTYSPVSIGTEGDNTKLYLGAGDTLYWPNGTMAINTHRAFFQLGNLIAGEPKEGQTGINAFVLNFGDGTETGISLTSNPSSLTSDSWYTLDGRKLNGKPKAKGIYINNGQKVVLK